METIENKSLENASEKKPSFFRKFIEYIKRNRFWIFSILLMIFFAVFQKGTGPTYPKKGEMTIAGELVKYELIRTNENTDDKNPNSVFVKIRVKNPAVTGVYSYKRVSSYDDWTTKNMVREGDDLVLTMPRLKEFAGKLEYTVKLMTASEEKALTTEPIRMRFKGHVPWYILIPHILFLFIGLIFTVRTGLEAVFNLPKIKHYARWSFLLLFIGGMVFGPFVQKFAFGEYWTGIPFGWDLTDNKTLFMVTAWFIALLLIYKKIQIRTVAIVATLIVLAMYLIPHSTMGSEYDYKKVEQAPNTSPAPVTP